MTTISLSLAIASIPEVQLVAAQRQYLIATLGDQHLNEMAIVDCYGWTLDHYCGGDADLAYEVLSAVFSIPNRVRVTSLDEALQPLPGEPVQLNLF
ncbi:hypothetical protein [Acaryochloris sp. CCMEE 5410]|uniref:hypothetical protein n=1 Tax=Acaryochloris sp. CCMEE 5410 TaxID=310037 RepID=UPI0002485147|nr:hypothetical protein [Acaryochloris sp. CCMEE 5410]KAI9130118.1 hypothetical protein ON05_031315 [Acaryochloris sp. CCMEE 5410]